MSDDVRVCSSIQQRIADLLSGPEEQPVLIALLVGIDVARIDAIAAGTIEPDSAETAALADYYGITQASPR